MSQQEAHECRFDKKEKVGGKRNNNYKQILANISKYFMKRKIST
jgi:hypothetical protein